MNSTQLAVIENDTPSHLSSLIREMGLMDVAHSIDQDGVPEEVTESVHNLISVIGEIFSLSRPDMIENSPVKTLIRASNELKLAHLLRERGFFRLFLVIAHRDENELPPWHDMINPFTGDGIITQNDFISWFTKAAGISRATTFNRMSAIRRLLNIDMTLDEVFDRTALMPEAVRKGLDFVASWNNAGEIIGIPERGLEVMKRYADEETLQQFEDAYEDGDMETATALYKPAIRELMDDFTELDSAKEALTFLKNDVLLTPEISYVWDDVKVCIVVTYIRRDADGREVDFLKTDLYLNDIDAPIGIWKDIIDRLPVANKREIEFALD